MSSPIKPTIKSEFLPILLIILAAAISYYIYPMLPERVASHWNFYGQVDGWSSKKLHTTLFPGILAGMYLLFLVIPYIDPKKERYGEFAKVYHIFKLLIIGVFFLVYLVASLYNLGYNINVGYFTATIVGLMMILLGNYMGKIKKNWFMGIRTPWTMSSENVWNKTHRVGGWMFILFGLIIIIAPYLPIYLAAACFIGGILLVTIGTMAYSYIIYKQEEKTKIQ
jgi:uncharacterized membrane protein